MAVARDLLDQAAFAAAWADGRAMTMEQAVAYALAEEAPAARPDKRIGGSPLATGS